MKADPLGAYVCLVGLVQCGMFTSIWGRNLADKKVGRSDCAFCKHWGSWLLGAVVRFVPSVSEELVIIGGQGLWATFMVTITDQFFRFCHSTEQFVFKFYFLITFYHILIVCKILLQLLHKHECLIFSFLYLQVIEFLTNISKAKHWLVWTWKGTWRFEFHSLQ